MKTRSLLSPVLLIGIMFKLTCYTYGQSVIFNQLMPPGGSDFGNVMGFAQDNKGSIWIAQSNGVYSFNGAEITAYRTNPISPNSLAYNFAHSIFADKNGMIWIGTLGRGLDMLDPETGSFTNFNHDPNDPASLVNDTVTVVFIDSEEIIWIGTHNGLDRFDTETSTFEHYRYDENDTNSLSNNQVRVIYEDSQGALWIGTGSPYLGNGGRPEDGGLNKLNRETGSVTRYMNDANDSQSLVNNKVSAIFEDDYGTFWIGTWKKGIQKMDRGKGTFETAFTESEMPELYRDYPLSEGLIYDYISFITQDAAGRIWFATSASGIYNFDPANNESNSIYGPANPSSGFSDRGARSSFSSRDGTLWIGTNDANIYYTDPSVTRIQHTSISGFQVASFYEEQNGDFWIGTLNEIIRNIKETGEIKRYGTEDYNINAYNNPGYRIEEDREGNIWVLTTESLNRFDRKTEKFIAYKNDPENENSISSNYIITTYEDSKSNFWVGTTSGLNLMDRKTGLFTRVYAHPEYTTDYRNVILSIVEDNSGILWIGNWNNMGVNRFDPENKDFKDYLKGVTAWELIVDSNGILWAGTELGLFKYEPGMDEFRLFTLEGLQADLSDIQYIIEDTRKNLWLTTRDEIVRINPERNEINFFGLNYGIGQDDFIYKSGYVKRNGEIYFGDRTGYFSFMPEDLITSMKVPEIVFTDFRLAGKKLDIADGGPLYENLNVQKTIRLAHDQNVFSLDFAIVDYADPVKNRLSYFLENFDIEWHSANSERKAYYFNVPPGKYSLRIKGTNSYGTVNEKSIDITIDPPWWRTLIAYISYGILFIGAVFGVDRTMRRRIVLAERQKNQERELAQAREIEKAYNELKVTQYQLIQSEKMASLGELTAGIAHEIQNPLNFVNNFSEVNKELIDELKAERSKLKGERDEELEGDILDDIHENEKKINHHGQRASGIVKGMLEHSRTSDGKKEPTDINTLCDEYLRLAYHGMRAKDKGFNADYKLELDEALPKIKVVSQDIGRVLLNLINNAFYAVAQSSKLEARSKDYQPEVKVSTAIVPLSEGVQGEGKIEIRVRDNGPGIPKEVRDKIFQPFFTTKPTGQGTGLGLSLSYDIITKGHGGTIEVESETGRGTEFIVRLPIV